MDGYAPSPNDYPEVDCRTSRDSPAAVSVATAVLSVSAFTVMPEPQHSRVLIILVSIGIDHGPTASSSQRKSLRIRS